MQFKGAETKLELRDALWEIIRKVLVDLSTDQVAIDTILYECAAQPVLFELGISVAMHASEYVREAFRRRLVECGAAFETIRLVKLMDRPLSRDEMVMLGNRCAGGIVQEEVLLVLVYARGIEGITELDLRRLEKQLGAKAA